MENIALERWKDHSGGFLAFSSIISAIFFIVPAVAILGVLSYFDIAAKFWLPVMIIYAIGVISQQITYGVGAVNIQIQISSEYTVDRLGRQLENRTSNAS